MVKVEWLTNLNISKAKSLSCIGAMVNSKIFEHISDFTFILKKRKINR
ncbi:protein of unknown function [Paenibacillus alvei]|uniref:Uncharacterized protein n=1 Tax=Paenibacillus alvei TaxID=44250 RepID=A0A383R792_PAEAL|nr:protein of unknown function [Paenibacillus alvei]